MPNISLYFALMIIAVFISSISQILLKISANRPHEKGIHEYLNPWVITAYIIFFAASILSVTALRKVPVNHVAIIEASGYIYVAIMARIFLKEKISRKTQAGLLLILIGIVVFLID